MNQRAEARIDLDALKGNCRTLRALLEPGVELCPVLKADGYGHGAAGCARAAAEAGVDRIAMATAREAVQIRSAVPEMPLLVLGAMSPPEIDLALSTRAEVSAWDPGFIAAIDARAAKAGRTVGVHVKYDTGMGRLGSFDPGLVLAMCRQVDSSSNLDLRALWTHFATADEADRTFLDLQRERLASLGGEVRSEFPAVKLHAANSAAMICEPETHFDMVRPGVAVYGMDPFGIDAAGQGLQPVLSFHSYVASVKHFEPGMSAGYGRTWIAGKPTRVATVPVGYGDGVRRALSNRGHVIIGGNRFPIAGTISMDYLTVDLGDSTAAGTVNIGDEVTLIGSQGEARITSEEVARHFDSINYEVTCGISPRVPRHGVGRQA
jgi:alanine racemase